MSQQWIVKFETLSDPIYPLSHANYFFFPENNIRSDSDHQAFLHIPFRNIYLFALSPLATELLELKI